MRIKNFEDYQILTDGTVIGKSGKPLSQAKQNSGYLYVTLMYTDGYRKSKNMLIHRLVAEHYIPNPDNLPYVNHIDGNKHNNDISNLEWVSASDNVIHAYKTGLNKHSVSVGGYKDGELIIVLPVLEFAKIVFDNKSANTNIVCAIKTNGTAYGYSWKYLNDRYEPIE